MSIMLRLLCGLIMIMLSSCGNSSSPVAPHNAAMDKIELAIYEYKAEHGAWPTSLSSLPDQNLTSFRGQAFTFNPITLELSLSIRDVNRGERIVNKVSGGHFGTDFAGITRFLEKGDNVAEQNAEQGGSAPDGTGQ